MNNSSIRKLAARPVYTYLNGPAASACRSALKTTFSEGLESGLSHRDVLQVFAEEYYRLLPPLVAAPILSELETVVTLLSEEGSMLCLKEAVGWLAKNERNRKRWHERIVRGEIVSFQTVGGQWCVPRWQFTTKGKLLPGIVDVVKILRSKPDFEAMTPFIFFLQANSRTQGKTPLSCLRAGKVTDVVCAARS